MGHTLKGYTLSPLGPRTRLLCKGAKYQNTALKGARRANLSPKELKDAVCSISLAGWASMVFTPMVLAPGRHPVQLFLEPWCPVGLLLEAGSPLIMEGGISLLWKKVPKCMNQCLCTV
mmetsp:Transcript_88181/g.153188  ORF Transcript_88181/g.153188 Transcript_88181/m.153188 type:complete len:118 (-) Transcript_88181:64-417(-)